MEDYSQPVQAKPQLRILELKFRMPTRIGAKFAYSRFLIFNFPSPYIICPRKS